MNIRSREQIKADYADKASGVHENKFIFAPPPGIYEEVQHVGDALFLLPVYAQLVLAHFVPATGRQF